LAFKFSDLPPLALRGCEKIVDLLQPKEVPVMRAPSSSRAGGASRPNPGHLAHQTPQIWPQRSLSRTPADALATAVKIFTASDCRSQGRSRSVCGRGPSDLARWRGPGAGRTASVLPRLNFDSNQVATSDARCPRRRLAKIIVHAPEHTVAWLESAKAKKPP
jgi:hypothetical protein